MPKTTNENIHDAMLRRQVYLEKYTQGAQRTIAGILNSTEGDVRQVLESRLSGLITEDGQSAANASAAIQKLAQSVADVRHTAIDQSFNDLTDELGALGPNEAKYVNDAFHQYSPVKLDTVLPAAAQLGAIILTEPMQGKLLSDWAEQLKAADTARIMDTVRAGMAQGLTTDKIVRNVLGTDVVNGADGAVELTRANAAALAQTAISTVASTARGAYSEANSDIVGKEVWVATLDSVTCEECAALDGQQFDVGEGEDPPAHYNCRCVRVPTLDGNMVGDRPYTTATEDALDGMPEDERAQAVKDMTGQVPASTTYQDWLTGQSEAFQDDVLGPDRAQLFRDGMPLARFVNRDGDVLTLEELHARGASSLFVSPTTDELSFGDAVDNLDGARQAALSDASTQIADMVGLDTTSTADVVGAWDGGAENALAMNFAPGASFEDLRAAAAMNGELAGQRSVLAFQQDTSATAETANAFLGQLDIPGSVEDVHAALQDSGLPAFTLQPLDGGGVRVLVYGEDQDTLAALNKIGEDHGQQVQLAFGRGEFVGSPLADSAASSWNAEAVNQYEATIRAFLADKHPRDAAEWQRIYSDWSRTESKLAEQGEGD